MADVREGADELHIAAADGVLPNSAGDHAEGQAAQRDERRDIGPPPDTPPQLRLVGEPRTVAHVRVRIVGAGVRISLADAAAVVVALSPGDMIRLEFRVGVAVTTVGPLLHLPVPDVGRGELVQREHVAAEGGGDQERAEEVREVRADPAEAAPVARLQVPLEDRVRAGAGGVRRVRTQTERRDAR